MIPIPFTVLWLIALIVFAVGEAITVGLTSVWFAVGALGALIAAGFGGRCGSRWWSFWLCPG